MNYQKNNLVGKGIFITIYNKLIIMKKLLLLLSLIFLTCTNKDGIPFKMVGNLPVIEAELNGINGKFLLDSGAEISILDLNSMYIYGYSIDETKPKTFVTGIGGSKPTFTLKNVELSLDGVPIGFIFKGLDIRTLRRSYGIVGIIGSDYMNKHNLMIDYEAKTLRKR